MIHIHFSEELLPLPDLTPWIEKIAERSLKILNIADPTDFSIELGTDEEIRALNRDYLGFDKPTDVLSFPSGGEKDPETGVDYLGDIFISYSRASDQAAKAGHSLEAEIGLLTIHGILHLFGHDHANDHEKKLMWELQEKILNSLNIHLAIKPGEDVHE